MNRLQTLLASKKFQKALPWAAGAILALGVITFLQVLNSPKDDDPAPASSGPAQLINEPRTVPPSPEARRVRGPVHQHGGRPEEPRAGLEDLRPGNQGGLDVTSNG